MAEASSLAPGDRPHDVAGALAAISMRIRELERRYDRTEGSVRLLAVSKTKPAGAIAEAHRAGQVAFGENYVQEAVAKQDELATLGLQWHFIGPLQSNKTRVVAQRFAWVHTVDRPKIARRLDDQRPPDLPPLDVCIEVNVSAEQSKGGVAPGEVAALAEQIEGHARLRLRGLMAIPAPAIGLDAQREPLRRLRELQESLIRAGHRLDTLSMGMTGDMEAAIAEGSTMVRIGTAIFGARPPK